MRKQTEIANVGVNWGKMKHHSYLDDLKGEYTRTEKQIEGLFNRIVDLETDANELVQRARDLFEKNWRAAMTDHVQSELEK